MMLYHEHEPSVALRPFIECFWTARSAARPSPSPRELLLPDGTTQLLLTFAGSYRRFDDAPATRPERVTGSHLVGLRTRGVFIEQVGQEDIFAIRFHPGGLSPFTPIPVAETVHESIPLEELLGSVADELAERVFAAPTPKGRVRAAERVLLRLLGEASAAEKTLEPVRRAVRRIYASRGGIPIDRLCADLGLGHRTLDRVFKQHVGINPKRLCRIVRFNYSLSLMLSGRGASQAGIAYEAGYADQAHMIRDFRQFAHSSPTEFLARRYGIVEVSQPALRARLSKSFNPDG